jgi:hypothetical protein
MAPSTPTRRVLSDLNVNTPTARGGIQPSKLGASGSTKLHHVGEIYFQAEVKQDAGGDVRGAAVGQETWMGSRKRCSDVTTDGIDGLPNKRLKKNSSPKAVGERVLPDARGDQTFGSSIADASVLQSLSPRVSA